MSVIHYTIYLSLTPRNVVNFVFLYFFEAYLNCYPERAAGPNLQKMMKPSNLKPVKHVTVRRAGMIPILELQINRKGDPQRFQFQSPQNRLKTH